MRDEAEKLRNFDEAKGLRAAARAAARAAVYVAQADAYDAARAATSAASAAVFAADEAAIWETLDGLLEIGPSGQAYTQEHLDRLPELREAVQA